MQDIPHPFEYDTWCLDNLFNSITGDQTKSNNNIINGLE